MRRYKNCVDWAISSQAPNRGRFNDYRNHAYNVEESRVDKKLSKRQEFKLKNFGQKPKSNLF